MMCCVKNNKTKVHNKNSRAPMVFVQYKNIVYTMLPMDSVYTLYVEHSEGSHKALFIALLIKLKMSNIYNNYHLTKKKKNTLF